MPKVIIMVDKGCVVSVSSDENVEARVIDADAARCGDTYAYTLTAKRIPGEARCRDREDCISRWGCDICGACGEFWYDCECGEGHEA